MTPPQLVTVNQSLIVERDRIMKALVLAEEEMEVFRLRGQAQLASMLVDEVEAQITLN
tara:strand:- start:113 stop:286 length:174 start_codon:yes stop_codon:yes gene_type:complete